MFFNNSQPEIKKDQKQLAKKYQEETITMLQYLRQEAARLGNDNGETSKINELIEKFKNDEISGEKAKEEAHKIIYAKEAGIDANTGGH